MLLIQFHSCKVNKGLLYGGLKKQEFSLFCPNFTSMRPPKCTTTLFQTYYDKVLSMQVQQCQSSSQENEKNNLFPVFSIFCKTQPTYVNVTIKWHHQAIQTYYCTQFRKSNCISVRVLLRKQKCYACPPTHPSDEH